MDDARPSLSTLPTLHRAPAVPLAAAVLAGAALGKGAVYAPVGALVALALLGAALASGQDGGRRRRAVRAAGLSVVALSLSVLNAGVRGGSAAALVEPGRPVTAVVETTGHWRRLGEVWSAPVRVERLRQGSRVLGPDRVRIEPVYLHLTADTPPPFGARLRVRGFLGRPVPLGNLPPRSPGPWLLRVKSSRLVTVEEGPGALARLAGGLRRRVEEGFRRAAERRAPLPHGSPPGLGLPLARALLLGDSSQVPPPVVRGLRRLGLAHVLAVSGLHVGLVAGLVLLLAGPLPSTARWGLSLVAVLVYLLLVGPRPSLLRASAMALLVVAALLVERPPSAVNALAVVAAGIVLTRPEAVSEAGFQLSVGATAGLLLLAPVFSRSWVERGSPLLARVPGPVRDALAVSAGAQVGTLPWALPLFSLVVPAAPVVNLVAVPWTLLVLPAAGLWALLAVLAPAAAAAVRPALDLLAAPFAWPAALPPSPWASLPLAAGPVAAWALAGALTAALARPRVGLPLVLLGWVWAAGFAGRLPVAPDAGVELVAVDVGQGDAILLRDGGEALLVDGGGWPAGDLGGRVLLPTLAGRGVRRLDRVLLTHGDRDHCAGLLEVASYLSVGEVLTGPGPADGPCEAELRRSPGTAHRAVAAGDGLRVGRWRLRVLHTGDAAGPASAGNDASVVVVAEAFGHRVLLTGDVEATAEERLVAEAGPALDCDVLKVAHHGSHSSSTEGFLRAAAPSLALVSAGARNPYGHPAPQVLARLRRHRAQVLRTDRDGMIVLRFFPDGRWEIDLPGSPKG